MILFNPQKRQSETKKVKNKRNLQINILKNQKLFISSSNFFYSKNFHRKFITNNQADIQNSFENKSKEKRAQTSLSNQLSKALKIKEIRNMKTVRNFNQTNFSKNSFTQNSQNKSIYKIPFKQQKKGKLDICSSQPSFKQESYEENLIKTNNFNSNIQKKEKQVLDPQHRNLSCLLYTPIFKVNQESFDQNQKYMKFIKLCQKKYGFRYSSQPTITLSNYQIQQKVKQQQNHDLNQKMHFQKRKFRKINKIRQKIKRKMMGKRENQSSVDKNCLSFVENKKSNGVIKHTEWKINDKICDSCSNFTKKQRHIKIIKKTFTHQLMISGNQCHKYQK